ncbi:hypothetical protein GGX14DRAFT_388107 [Mycena pura]|uniref:Uncharacterized protein n=1 Tax=Mycena pura TaxID=153505 RepID=A0AAD6VTG8_9AGAR|nr:hypothetical protein GGX14DRAFT_388107 [Mycena pura]
MTSLRAHDLGLRDETTQLASREPLASAFQELNRLGARRTSQKHIFDQTVHKLVADRAWVTVINDYLSFALGGDVISDGIHDVTLQAKTFLDIVWAGTVLYGTSEGTEMLEHSFLDARKTLMRGPPPVAPASQFSPGTDFADGLDDFVSSDDESRDADFTPDGDRLFLPKSPATLVPNRAQLKPRPRPLSQCVRNIMEAFYKETSDTDNDCVEDLQWMRLVPASIFNSPKFQKELQDSGLHDLFLDFCPVANFLEFRSAWSLQSFRHHNWKLAYAELLVRWTSNFQEKEDIGEESEDDDEDYVDPDDTITINNDGVLQFLTTMSDEPRLQPWPFNPMAVFLFVSRHTFLLNWRLWLKPYLQALQLPFAYWNPALLYRRLCQLPAMQSLPDGDLMLARLNPSLREIIKQTGLHRKIKHQLKSSMFVKASARSENKLSDRITSRAPTLKLSKSQKKNHGRRHPAPALAAPAEPSWLTDNGCELCKHKADTERCARLMEVWRVPDVASYDGYAIAFSRADLLRPKNPLPTKNTTLSHKPDHQQKYTTPEELGLRWVEPRPLVMQRCLRDIVRFYYVDEHGCKQIVGGVRFGAYPPGALRMLQYNHRLVRVRAIRRREALDRWSNIGKMSGAGVRQPVGGGKADIYGPYACHDGNTPDDIKALFRHGLASVWCMAAKSVCSDITDDYASLAEDAELGLLGSYGLTCYYCTNYVTCVHADHDVEESGKHNLHPSSQLIKRGCNDPREWGFAYVEWGIAVRTDENCVWIFNANHRHASVMPTGMSVASGQAVSAGTHSTNNCRNVERARACREVRRRFELRQAAYREGSE